MLQTPKDHSDWRKLEEAVSDDWDILVKGLHSPYFELYWPCPKNTFKVK